ncbi:MAG: ATP-binding cassette domain-containing protein [Pseudomonadota bacterium]|nr:ATP-binding cassette domain-containing protein [Pseudomonadota bacterium]
MDMSPDIVIRVEGLKNRFDGQIVHDGLDMEVRRGEVIAVVGGSGSGKSVLLKSIVGLLPPLAGRINMFGQDMRRIGTSARAGIRKRIGVLFQDGALFSGQSVARNVALPLIEQTDLPAATIDAVVRVKLAMAGLDAADSIKTPDQLSGGMRKRAGLARALALDPEILFLDEPTAGLDPIGAARFDRLIVDLKASLGLTVFLVTHDLDSLYAIADRVAVLVDGKLVTGSLAEVSVHPNPWIHNYFHGPRGRAAGRLTE